MTVATTLTGPDFAPTLILTLSPARNRVQWGEGEPYRFNRRWEAHMLALLLERARLGQPLLASDLNTHLLARGQSRPLNRSQVQRLVLSLSTWLATLPGRPWTLDHAPRKLSVGPWFLATTLRTPVEIRIEESAERAGPAMRAGITLDQTHGPQRSQWPSPLVLDHPASDCDSILQRLATWTVRAHALIAPDSASPGNDAADSAAEDALTPEARISLGLIHLHHWRQHGEGPLSRRRVEARQALEALQALLPQAPRDPGLTELVRLQGLRNLLLFDPDLHAGHVLQESLHPRPLMPGASGLAQWHQLRAQAGWLQAARPAVDEDSAARLHGTSALHLESLLYWSLQSASREGLQCATALAQQHLPALHARGLCSAATLQAWQGISPAPAGPSAPGR